MAQLVGRPTLDFGAGHHLPVSVSPASGSALTVRRLFGILSPSLSVPLPLVNVLPLSLSLSLSLSQK